MTTENLKEFARKVIAEVCWGYPELDGFEIQELAEKLNLIESCIATEEDVDEECDYEVGDQIYKFTDVLKKEISLRECPFCGSEDIHIDNHASAVGYLRFQAWCDDCGCSRDGKQTFDEAVIAWNTRHPDTELVKALERFMTIKEHMKAVNTESFDKYKSALQESMANAETALKAYKESK